MSDEIHLTLRPLPRFGGNSTLRLRHLLKAALRSYGFQFTKIEGDGDLAQEPELTTAERDQRAVAAVFGTPPPLPDAGAQTSTDDTQAVRQPQRGTGHLRGSDAKVGK